MDSIDAKYLTEALQDIATAIREANRPMFITVTNAKTDHRIRIKATDIVSMAWTNYGGSSLSFGNTSATSGLLEVTETPDEITKLIKEANR